MDPTYQIAELNIINQIAELRWLAHWEDNESIKESKKEYVERCVSFLEKELNINWFHFVANIDNEIIGIASVFVFERLPAPGRMHAFNAYLTNVYIKKEHRKKGIGTNLINKIKKWGEEKSINTIMLFSSEDGIKLYEKTGFKNKMNFYSLDTKAD